MIPKYQQLADAMEQDIRRNYAPGHSYRSIRDLMRAYNVSLQTVNRALSILEQKRVVARVQGKGTYVLGSGHGLAIPKQLSLYIVTRRGTVDVLENPYFSGIYRGIQDVVVDRHVKLAFGSYGQDFESVAASCVYDAAMFINPPFGCEEAIDRAASNVPCVLTGGRWPGMAVPRVDTDISGCMLECLEHVRARGHKRIGYMGLAMASFHDAIKRESFIEHATALGLEIRPEWMIECDTGPINGMTADAVRQLLLAQHSPTCYVISSLFYLSTGLIRYITDLAGPLPGLSFIGFDNPEWAEYVLPSLSTIGQDFPEIGRRAAVHLLDRIAGRTLFQRLEYVPAKLLDRGSVMDVSGFEAEPADTTETTN